MEQQAPKVLGVSRSTLYRWRIGVTHPSARMRDAMVRAGQGMDWGMPFESNTWVRAVRQTLELGQAEFAYFCGTSQSNVSKWEIGSLALSREVASELHLALDLPASLDPASPTPCETDDEVMSRYAEQTNALIVQSEPDADWRAAQFCSAIGSHAGRSAEAGRVLASTYANRSLWHLVHQGYRESACHGQTAIKLGKLYGFTVDSGYALWSLARTRFLPGFGSVVDVALLDREISLVENKLDGVPATYASLLRGARAMAIGDGESCETELARAKERAPGDAHVGVVGRWGESYWRRDITLYHAMLALCTGRFFECCRVIEPLAEEQFAQTVAHQYVQSVARHYFHAANVRLGCRERVVTNGPLVPQRILNLMKQHTARLTG